MTTFEKIQALKREKAKANLDAGTAFMAANALKEGVFYPEIGFQYEILKEGNGDKPGPRSKVTCHYHGTTITGEVFDSSVNRGKPSTFALNQVISGWTIALQMMPVGSKWRLVLPPHLAYGNDTISKEIGPNSTLIFEVELLSFA